MSCMHHIYNVKHQKSYTPYYFMFPAERTRDVQTLPDSKHLILYFIYDHCLKNISNAMQTKINNSLLLLFGMFQELYVLYIYTHAQHTTQHTHVYIHTHTHTEKLEYSGFEVAISHRMLCNI